MHTKTLATALARAVDAKDSYTRSHCETVVELCVTIAERLGLEPDALEQLRLAGLLHDVGKIGVPDTILQKPSALTDSEYETMKTHSRLGHSIVSGAGLLEEARWILHHHERPDGRGYPYGLHGEEIPLESRIILVADAFEAMTSDRPYRRSVPASAALDELHRHAGTQFDPECVAALEGALTSRRAPVPVPARLEQVRERRPDVAGDVEQRRRARCRRRSSRPRRAPRRTATSGCARASASGDQPRHRPTRRAGAAAARSRRRPIHITAITRR